MTMIKQFEKLQTELDKEYIAKKELYKKANNVLESLVSLGMRIEPMVNPVTKQPYCSTGLVKSYYSNQIVLEWTMWDWQLREGGQRACGNGYGKFTVSVSHDEKTKWSAEHRKNKEEIKLSSDMIPASIIGFIKNYKEELEIG